MIQLVVLICAISEQGPECVQMEIDAPPHMTSCEMFDPQKAAHAVGALLLKHGVAFERLGVRCQEGA